VNIRRLPRRRLLAAALGAVVTVVVAASCTRPPDDTDPPDPSPSPDASMLRDDVVDGIAVEDRGFSAFPVPGGSDTRRIIGAAAVLRNTTDRPMRVHVRYRFVDGTGRGWQSGERSDWAGIVSAGWAYLPPGQAVDLGDGGQFAADEAARVAGIVLYVNGEGKPTTKTSVLLPAKIDRLLPRPALSSEWDYVSFDVDNTWGRFSEPNYVLVFRSPDGRLIGGWFVDRGNWWDIEKSLPKGETDEYRDGTSRHTLPTVLPPGIRPEHVTMYLWP
jgi:hypothetical protein